MKNHFSVIGNPIEHSLSPFIHQAFAKQTGIEIHYKKILAPIDQFDEYVLNFQKEGASGANITLPFKAQAFNLATKKTDAAKTAGAANTLQFKANGDILADNTDGTGLTQDLIRNNEYSIRQKNILILGAGGAVRGVIGALLELAPASITIANRTPEKAISLANHFNMAGNVTGIDINNIEHTPFDLIIQGTSLGIQMKLPTVPKEIIGDATWCYDLMYGEEATPFLSWAEQQGAAKCLDGLGMLVEQAAASFYLWHGVYPRTRIVIDALQKNKYERSNFK